MGAIVTRSRTHTHTHTHTHTEATRAEENESIRGMGARQRCCAHLGFPTRCLALPWVGNMAGCPSATNTYHCKADMCGSCDCVGEIRLRHGPYTTPSWIKLWCGNLPWKMIVVLLYRHQNCVLRAVCNYMGWMKWGRARPMASVGNGVCSPGCAPTETECNLSN